MDRDREAVAADHHRADAGIDLPTGMGVPEVDAEHGVRA